MVVEHHKAGILSTLYHELPVEIMRECFSFLDWIEIVFSIGFVCSEWRRSFAWPLIDKHLQLNWLVDCEDDMEQINCFDDLFRRRLGRNCLRFMMRSFVFDIAQQVVKKHDDAEKGIFKLGEGEHLEISKLLKFYFSQFELPSTLVYQAKYQRSEILGLEILSVDEPIIESMRKNYKKNIKYEKNLYTHKVLILGKEKTGKTNFLNSVSGMNFSETPKFEEHSFRSRLLYFGDMFRVNSQVWEMNDKIFYYSSRVFEPLSALFITFDITNRLSFDNLVGGLGTILSNRKKYSEIVIIGLKSDLRNSNSVSRQEVERLLIQHLPFEGSYYIEVSSKNRTNIDTTIWFTSLMVSSIQLFTNIPPKSSAP